MPRNRGMVTKTKFCTSVESRVEKKRAAPLSCVRGLTVSDSQVAEHGVHREEKM